MSVDLEPDVANAETAALADNVRRLNQRFKHHAASDVLAVALQEQAFGKVALVSSFGADSVVLLHMVAMLNRATPVLFLDTRLLFTETLVYQQELAERLNLSQIRILRTSKGELERADPYGALRFSDPDGCCALRKTQPLQAAMDGLDGWITGRKRFQSEGRATLPFFELDGAGKVKINPLAHWRREDVAAYIEENRLPRHPLVAKGYPSIGCAPCTSKTQPGEDPRNGRWRGSSKTECGIHFDDAELSTTQAKA